MYVLICALVVVPASIRSARAGTDEGWKLSVTRGLTKMETFFGQARGAGVITKRTKLKGLSNSHVEETWQRSGKNYRYTRLVLEPDISMPESVYCRNDKRYVFALQRGKKDAPFLAKKVLPKDSPLSEIDDLLSPHFFLASHCVYGVPLSRILDDRSFSLTSESLHDGVLVLRFEWSPTPETMPNLVFPWAELTLRQSNGWAIEKYRLPLGPRGSKGVIIDGVVEYKEIKDGVAIPSRIVEQHGSFATEECVFKDIGPAAFNESEFTLSHYGLPEPIGAEGPTSSRSTWFIWLIGGGVVCIGSGAYIARRVQKAKTMKGA